METVSKSKVSIHDIRYAVCRRDETTLREILQNLDIKIDINTSVFGSTILSETLYNGQQRMFEMLLMHDGIRQSININRCSEDGKHRLEPPIVTACRLGNKEAVRLLLLCGANVDACDSCGRSALWTASRYRFGSVVEYLVSNGANVNCSMKYSHSALYLALRYPGTRTPMAVYLLYHGAGVDLEGGDRSLLHCALSHTDSCSLVPLLFEAGYRMTTSDYWYFSENRNQLPAATCSVILEELGCPPSLQRQCRKVIRSQVSAACRGKHVEKRLTDLSFLPVRMRLYLLMKANFDALAFSGHLN